MAIAAERPKRVVPSKGVVGQNSQKHCRVLPEVSVSAVVLAIVDPAMLVALTEMVYMLSSLRPLRVCDLMEPSEMVSVRGAPCGAEHRLTV